MLACYCGPCLVVVLTRRGMSIFLLPSSVFALTLTASLRVSILMNAWRLSLFTIQVCTLPHCPKMPRNSCSEHLFHVNITNFQDIEICITHVTPPTNSVRLRTLIDPEGKLGSWSVHFSIGGGLWPRRLGGLRFRYSSPPRRSSRPRDGELRLP